MPRPVDDCETDDDAFESIESPVTEVFDEESGYDVGFGASEVKS